MKRYIKSDIGTYMCLNGATAASRWPFRWVDTRAEATDFGPDDDFLDMAKGYLAFANAVCTGGKCKIVRVK